MKKIVITMRSFKKFISQDLLQLALIIGLLKVDPENYLGLQPGPGPDGGGGVLLGAPPLLAGWPPLHLPPLAGKQVDSLLERYQEEILEDLNSLGRFSRLSLYGGVPVQLSAYLVDTEVDNNTPLHDGTDSDSGISDTDHSPPSPSQPDKEEDDGEDADLLGVFQEDFGFHSLLTPPPEVDEEGTESWQGMGSLTNGGLYNPEEAAEVTTARAAAAAADLFSDAESVLFEDEDGLVFGPEIPAELVEAGIPEIEDHGAIQLELMHMEEQLMHLDYDIEEINAASLFMDEKIAFSISEEEPEAGEDMDIDSFFGQSAPFDDWEREAFADISDLLNPPADVSSTMAPNNAQLTDDTPFVNAAESVANLDGAGALADSEPSKFTEEPTPQAIQDFDLDLLDSPKADPLLLDLLEVSSSSSSALRNDVMLTTGRANRTQPVGQLLGPVGYMPEEEAIHRPINQSRDEDDLFEDMEMTEGLVKEGEDLIAQVLKESEIFDAEIDLESSGIKMEFKEEDIKLEVEEEILLDQVVEVVPCPGYELDAEGACAQLDAEQLLEAAEDKGLLQFTLSRGMALAYNPSFNAAGFNNDHSSYVTNGRGVVKLESETTVVRRRNESESSSGYGSDENRPSRDERLATKAGLPFTARQLVDCSVEAFNEYLNHPRLTKEQVKLCKDIRRRGKNKVAAQNCRRRKMETIEELQSQVESVRMRRAALLQERELLETQRRRWSGKLEMMEQRVLAGLGKNIAEFTLQVDATRVRVTARLTTEVGGGAVRSAGGPGSRRDGRSRH